MANKPDLYPISLIDSAIMKPALNPLHVKFSLTGDAVPNLIKSRSKDYNKKAHRNSILENNRNDIRSQLMKFGARYTSVVKEAAHPKDTIVGIYEHPKIPKHGKGGEEEVPKSILLQDESLRCKKTKENYKSIQWKSEFATSNLSKTSLQAKINFDNIIKDWISTNWLDPKPLIQQKPCHILVHDKLLFQKISLFETVHELLMKRLVGLKIDDHVVKLSWNKEIAKAVSDKELLNHQLGRVLKDIIRSTYFPFAKVSDKYEKILNKITKDPNFIRLIISKLYKKVRYNDVIFDKLKNVENLNERNDITIIKDKELNLLPPNEYMGLLKHINEKTQDPLKSYGILKYKSTTNKLDDYENLKIMKNRLKSDSLHQNERFMFITNDRSTSLEYFRLLKLFNKTYASLGFKGCVIYIDSQHAQKYKESVGTTEYTGKELYYVIENFQDIYSIIEVL